MQKQKKQFITILIILVALVLCYVGLTFYNKKQQEKEDAETAAAKITVTSIAQSDVTALSFTTGGATLDFAKNADGDWYCTEDETVAIDQDAFTTKLGAVISITAESELTDSADLSEYELDNPDETVTITTADDSYTLSFGMTNAALQESYMMLDGDTNVYLVHTTVKTAFETTLEELTESAEDTETEVN